MRTRFKGETNIYIYIYTYLEQIAITVFALFLGFDSTGFRRMFLLYVRNDAVSATILVTGMTKSYRGGTRWFGVVVARCQRLFVWSDLFTSRYLNSSSMLEMEFDMQGVCRHKYLHGMDHTSPGESCRDHE